MIKNIKSAAKKLGWGRIITLLLAAAVVILFFTLHHILGSMVFPYFAEKSGFLLSCDVRKADLGNAVISDIALLKGKDAIQVSEISAEYSLPELLFRREFRKIRICGLNVGVSYSGGRLQSDFLPEKNSSAPIHGTKNQPPAFARKIEIRNAQLLVNTPDAILTAPFDVDAEYDRITGEYKFAGKILFIDSLINFSGTYGSRNSSIAFNSTNFNLSVLKSLPSLPKNFDAEGKISFFGKTDIATKRTEVSIRSDGFKLESGNVEIGSRPGEKFTLQACFGKEGFSADVTELCVFEPFPVALNSMTFKAGKVDGSMSTKIEGSLGLAVDSGDFNRKSPAGLKLVAPLQGAIEISGLIDEGKGWKINLKPFVRSEAITFSAGDESADKFALRQIQASVRGEGSGLEGTFNFACRASASLSGAKLSGSIPLLELFGTVKTGKKPEAKAFAKFTDTNIRYGVLKIDKASVLIPFEWPFSENNIRNIKGAKYDLGSFSIASAAYGTWNLGSISSQIYQDGSGYILAGTWKTPFENFGVEFSGAANLKGSLEAQLEMGIADAKDEKTVELKKISMDFPDISIKGLFNSTVHLGYAGGKASASAKFAVENASVEYPMAKLSASGLKLDISIPNAFEMWNAGRQRASFSAFQKGKLEASDAKIDFRLDSPGNVFVENFESKFCGGKIFCSSFNVCKGQDFSAVVYCDRIKVSSLFKIMGTGEASGEGTLSGRIPLRLNEGSIGIHDGFLYSAPGESGNILFKEVNMLPDGMKDPSAPNVAIALEALKDFNYKWLKFGLDTADNVLVIEMNIDGNPTNPLPFNFSEEKGLIRDENSPGLKLQGLQLNLNFSLPSEKMLLLKNINSRILGGKNE